MIADKMRMQKVVGLALSLFLVGICFPNEAEVNGGQSGRSLLLSIETDKNSYQNGEAVPLTLTITNKNTNTIWFRKADPYIELKSESRMIHGEGISEPNVPEPSHYYIRRNGKLVYTVPILRIEQGERVSERIPDALKRYHGYVAEGAYQLRARMTVGFFDESEVFVRPDFPNQLWVEPRGGLPQADLESNWLAIEIRKKQAEPEMTKPPPSTTSRWSWVSFLVGAAAAAAGFALVLLINRGTKPQT